MLRAQVCILLVAMVAWGIGGGCKSTSTVAQGQSIYVTQSNGELVFPITANGSDVAPTRSISGTSFSDGHRSAVDASGNIYVTDADNSSVAIFGPNASGDAAPTGIISGQSTGLDFPSGIALDASGKIYVANQSGASVTIYAAGTTGNTAPTVTITTGLSRPNGLALDGKGNIYIADEGNGNILEFAANPTGNETATATITTGLGYVHALALDSAGNIYVTDANGGGGVGSLWNRFFTVYAAVAATGSVTVYAAGATGNATPTATISGSSTGLNHPNGIAIDSDGNIYVANNGGPSVTVYAKGATGNATPTATISGTTNTELGDIHGVTVH